jgi:peptidyl-prolyl cis-trans isomerase SurA
MNRRVVVGLVGIALVGVAGTCPGQTPPARDPSSQQAVGLAPIPSIGTSINNTTVSSPVVPMAPSGVPTSPVGVGPDAPLPRSPIPPTAVSMTPMEPIGHSISRGFGTGYFSSLFRKPADRPSATILRTPPRVESSAKLDASTVPSMWTYPPRPATAKGRPAPFAGKAPETARPQADPLAPPTARPAPYAEERSRAARPRSTAPTTPAYRPAERPSAAPEPVRPAPAAPTTPIEPAPASLPAFEPFAIPPPIEPKPVPPAQVKPVPVEPMPAPDPVPSSPVDPNLSRTSHDEVAIRTGPVKARPLPYATMRAAAVGDEIITLNELAAAVKEQMRQMSAGQEPMSEDEAFQLKNQVAASVLNGMIDQALVVQAAKKKMMANPKAKEMFDEIIEKEWAAQELPVLLRNTTSANVHELKIKLAAEGKAYESMKEAYRKKFMFHEFLRAEIHNKVTADMIEMRHYYTEHLDKFEQPARLTWREIEINLASYPSRAAARQKAEEVLARLLHDEDFDAVAKGVSNGPTASKGGLYVDMQPGSYGIPVVNDELNRIPTGQVSQILEAPGSFHIIRVDSRREKGPLRFDEVQDKIRGMVLEQNYRRAVEEYLTKLRAKTLIRTMFDNTESDPELARRGPAGR